MRPARPTRALVLSALSLAVLAAGCGGAEAAPGATSGGAAAPPAAAAAPSPSAATTGGLDLLVTGLPGDAPVQVGQLTGPGGFLRVLTVTAGVVQRIVDLPPGRYTVVWHAVSGPSTQGTVTLAPRVPTQSVDIVAGVVAAPLAVQYVSDAPVTLAVAGLPPGAADNTVAVVHGANGWSTYVTFRADTLIPVRLDPGSYVVEWRSIELRAGNDVLRYASTTPAQQVTVEPSGAPVLVHATFGLASGIIEIATLGLPVSGENTHVGVLRRPDGNTIWINVVPGTTYRASGLSAGEYRMEWEPVTLNGARYRPTPPAHAITLVPSAQPVPVTATYAR